MGKIRLKSDLKLPVEMLNLFLTHVLPYWVVMPGYKQKQYTESVDFITATKRKLVSGIFGWVKKILGRDRQCSVNQGRILSVH